jgi:lipopolysaccharide export system protein LptA
MRSLSSTILLTFALALSVPPALAELADRSHPVNIEADRATVDDRTRTHVFEGRAILTQGSLTIQGERLVVTQGADGFQTGVATGTDTRLATFRQRREGTNDFVEGEAERIEYDSRTERAKLFNRARVSAGGDEVRGHYIEYDALTENYLASSPSSGDGRVRAVIQPKGAAAAGN